MGDEIREINGVNVFNKEIEALQRTLVCIRNDLTLYTYCMA